MPEPLLTPQQVAERCRLSRRAVYRAIERGELRATRLCAQLRVAPEAVDEWIAAGTVHPVERIDPPLLAGGTPGRLKAILDRERAA